VSIGTGTGAVQQQQAPEKPPRPGKRWRLAIVGLIGVYLALASYSLIANSGQLGSTAASATGSARTPTPSVNGTTGSASQSAKAGSSPAAAPGISTTSHPASHLLDVVSIAAFGPEGTADGDNPDLASRILDVASDQPWYSQWYETPEFGGLRQGTGLLLDLGESATVTGVSLTLGAAPGTDVQVRVGDSPSLALPTVAAASGVGGRVSLTADSPAKGRYVLVWFTRLPFVGQGHYQASVYDVAVTGR
jgi:hypothetical protein